jgi:photosystem II stability/assembly factor-like uncharacterized protein
MKSTGFLYLIFLLLSSSTIHAQDSWTRLTPTPQENTINFITKIPGTIKLIAVGEGSTVMISDDMGESWKLILNPAGMNNEYQCKGVCFIDENTGFIYGGKETILKTLDGGLTWELKLISNTIYEWKSINEIAFVNATTGFAVGDEGQLFKTTDCGETWLLNTYGANFNFTQIEFADSNTGFIVGANDSLLKTTNGGNSWLIIPYPDGLPSCSEMCFINDSIGFVSTSDGYPNYNGLIFKTTNKGLNWFQVYSDPSLYTCKFAFSDDLHGIAGGTSWAYSSKILVTNDGGDTWIELWPYGMPWLAINSLCTIEPNTAFTVGYYGMIFKSSNGGLDWEPKYNSVFRGDVYNAQFLNQDEGFTLSQVRGGGIPAASLMRTSDGGSSWQEIQYGCFDKGVLDFMSSDTGFVVYTAPDQLFYKTVDGGLNWEMFITGFDFEPLDMKFSDYNNGLISGEGHLIRTNDSGNTWTEANTGTNGWSTTFHAIEYVSIDTVFVAGAKMDTTTILRSFDGGNTWDVNAIGNYGVAKDIFFRDKQTAFLACYNTILKSIDGGNTWEATILNTTNPIDFRSIQFPSQDTGFAVGDGLLENMMKTTDGGNTWNVITSGITSGLNAVYFSDNNTGLIFGENGVESKTVTGGIVGKKDPGVAVSGNYFEVYPNPATSKVDIRLNQASNLMGTQLTINDMNGRQLKTIRIESLQPKLSISIEAFKPGFYVILLKNENCILESKKMIKL